MKKITLALLLLSLSSCINNTAFGPCVGLNDNQNGKLEYKISAWNVTMGVFFAGLVAPPIYVILDKLYCPVGEKL